MHTPTDRPTPNLRLLTARLADMLHEAADAADAFEAELLKSGAPEPQVREPLPAHDVVRTEHATLVFSRAPEPQARPSSVGAELAERADRARAASTEQWRAYLERHADKIEALRTSHAPAELPRGITLWLALDESHMVIGAGETIEEAHQAAVALALGFLTPEWLAGGIDAPDEEDELGLPFREPAAYVRVQGSDAAVWGLVKHVEVS